MLLCDAPEQLQNVWTLGDVKKQLVQTFHWWSWWGTSSTLGAGSGVQIQPTRKPQYLISIFQNDATTRVSQTWLFNANAGFARRNQTYRVENDCSREGIDNDICKLDVGNNTFLYSFEIHCLHGKEKHHRKGDFLPNGPKLSTWPTINADLSKFEGEVHGESQTLVPHHGSSGNESSQQPVQLAVLVAYPSHRTTHSLKICAVAQEKVALRTTRINWKTSVYLIWFDTWRNWRPNIFLSSIHNPDIVNDSSIPWTVLCMSQGKHQDTRFLCLLSLWLVLTVFWTYLARNRSAG